MHPYAEKKTRSRSAKLDITEEQHRAACRAGMDTAGAHYGSRRRRVERSAHPAIQSNSNESLVKEDGRVRVHAAERVEGKRDEAKVMHITDFPTRSDMRLIEAMPAWHMSQPASCQSAQD